MACAQQGVSIKEFLTRSVIKSLEEYEEELGNKSFEKTKEENEVLIPWEKAKKAIEIETSIQ